MPPYVKTNRSGVDNYFNNYKNPIFASKFVGYMRDEIYRFGIQFYDKSGNQSFTYPIGDIRFPAIENDYRVLGKQVVIIILLLVEVEIIQVNTF